MFAAAAPVSGMCQTTGAGGAGWDTETARSEMAAFWSTPSFRNQFLGTYGSKSEIEPEVTTLEKEELEKVLALMGAPESQLQAKILLSRTVTDAHSATFDFTMANIYFQEEKLDLAAGWYKRAVAKFPSFMRAHKNLGIVEVRRENYKEAVDSLTKAIELGASDGLSYGMLGYSYAALEKDNSAETAYRQAIMFQPGTVDWKVGLARCLFRQKKYEAAAALCADLIEVDPGRADYWLLEANAYLGMKQPLAAAVNYEYLLGIGKLPVTAMNSLGDIYVNEGLFDLAAGIYTNVIAQSETPDFARSLRNAEVLAMRAAPRAARTVVDAISKHAGAELEGQTKIRALKLEARLAGLEGRPAAEQVALLERIVAEDPLDGETLISLGRHYASVSELERGVFYFERAAGIEKYEAEACLRHGQALARAGRFADALPLLKRSHDMTPRDSLQRYIEQVERVARAQR